MQESKSTSERLCEDISSISGSVCFLAFSRGKDSIVSWIRLKKYFKTIIPFHCASIPHLKFVDKSLEYFENYFQTKIERFISGETNEAISKLWFSAIEDENEIDDLELKKHDKHDLVNYLRRKHNLPNAWCAYGINQSDSIDRIIYVSQYQGRIESHKSFYPCFDLKKDEIIKIIIDNKIRLPDDYKMANRTISDMIGFRGLENMMNNFPKDFERVELFFPFIKAIIARNQFRKLQFSPEQP